MSKLVSIITATIGRECLARCIESVKRQSYPNIQHIVVVDGEEHRAAAEAILCRYTGIDVLYLPYSTGQWGGRIYSAMPAISKGSFIMNLDDDNFLEPNHVASLVEAIGAKPWAYAMRNISVGGTIMMRDDCESLGPLHSDWNYLRVGREHYFIDTGCFFLSRKTALAMAPHWAPINFEDKQYHNDRMFFAALAQRFPQWVCSGKYTLNYEVTPERLEFFRLGNKWITDRYHGTIPWHDRARVARFMQSGKWE